VTAAGAPGTPAPSIMSPAQQKTRSAAAGGLLIGRADSVVFQDMRMGCLKT